jgi:hypothetical protein
MTLADSNVIIDVLTEDPSGRESDFGSNGRMASADRCWTAANDGNFDDCLPLDARLLSSLGLRPVHGVFSGRGNFRTTGV